jgi:hypothetical protein
MKAIHIIKIIFLMVIKFKANSVNIALPLINNPDYSKSDNC